MEKKRNYRRFTSDEKLKAIELYFTNGRSKQGVVTELGYPTKNHLSNWLKETSGYTPKEQVRYSHQIRIRAVKLVIEDARSHAEVARLFNVAHPSTVTMWCRKFKEGGMEALMADDDVALTSVEDSSGKHQEEVDVLKEKMYQLELENDILRGTIDVLKKDPGLNVEAMSNKEKTILANTLRPKYPLKEIIAFLKISKSSYSYQNCALKRTDKHADLRIKVREVFEAHNGRRGYRTIWAELRALDKPIRVSEKVVRAIMKEDGLIVPYAKRKRRFNTYMGEIGKSPGNVIQRNFSATAPNKKWLTDLTEFKVGGARCYLSPIIDCFDGKVVAWAADTSASSDLTNTMLKQAISTLAPGEKPILHSDGGVHYRWTEWISLINKQGIIRSMSDPGCTADNAACEGFFGRLKNEFYYYSNWKEVSIEEFIIKLNEYIEYYNERRIKQSLGWLSPSGYRRSLGMAA